MEYLEHYMFKYCFLTASSVQEKENRGDRSSCETFIQKFIAHMKTSYFSKNCGEWAEISIVFVGVNDKNT